LRLDIIRGKSKREKAASGIKISHRTGDTPEAKKKRKKSKKEKKRLRKKARLQEPSA
jgi:hypothetical protein